jgi:hypothetical protein
LQKLFFYYFETKLTALEIFYVPWPWYVAGVIIGLMVPALLIAGNKLLGVSASLRHICAACFPANISFLTYNWRKKAGTCFSQSVCYRWLYWRTVVANPEPEKMRRQQSHH